MVNLIYIAEREIKAGRLIAGHSILKEALSRSFHYRIQMIKTWILNVEVD
jgi:hypothetical protein